MHTQSQLVLPLLQVLADAGGAARPKEAADRLAERLQLPDAVRHETTTLAGRIVNRFDRTVRWTRQIARERGLINPAVRGEWRLSPLAEQKMRHASPGIFITLYESDDGIICWSTCEALEATLQTSSINAIVTSPPYPIPSGKAYGTWSDEGRYLDWLTDRATAWKDLLTPRGSLFLNLGDAWIPGSPTQSLYQERLLLRLVDGLGFHLSQNLFAENRRRLPAPAEWVTVRRVRVRSTIERVLWLSKTPNPAADNRAVLTPYSRSMHRAIRRGGSNPGLRPSGHHLKPGAFAADNGGAIPTNVIPADHDVPPLAYREACARNIGTSHPARFPETLPSFCIKLSTTEGQTVYDPFAGSLTTAVAARALGRNFICSDRDRDYLTAGLTRLA